jgi:hypothetical protein
MSDTVSYLAGVGHFEGHGQIVGRVLEDMTEAMVDAGGDDGLPLDGTLGDRGDGLGEVVKTEGRPASQQG